MGNRAAKKWAPRRADTRPKQHLQTANPKFVIGNWKLVFGNGELAIGDWQLAIGKKHPVDEGAGPRQNPEKLGIMHNLH